MVRVAWCCFVFVCGLCGHIVDIIMSLKQKLKIELFV